MDEIEKIKIKLRYAENFNKLIDSLCFTDRQKEIAKLKYLRGWVNADIAAELYIDRKTVTSEMKIIREIMGNIRMDDAEIDKFSKL